MRSIVINAMNAVICSKKLIKIDTVAYSAKVFTAGISFKAPIPKQHPCEIAESKIDGPTSPSALDTASLDDL